MSYNEQVTLDWLKCLVMTNQGGRMERWHAKSKIPQVLFLQYKLLGLYWHKVNEIVSDKYKIVFALCGNS